MTREEAINKIKYWRPKDANDWCSVFEALGLIKFEETKDEELMKKAEKYSKNEFMHYNYEMPETTKACNYSIFIGNINRKISYRLRPVNNRRFCLLTKI